MRGLNRAIFMNDARPIRQRKPCLGAAAVVGNKPLQTATGAAMCGCGL